MAAACGASVRLAGCERARDEEIDSKFAVGDLLKNMHSWAKHIPPYPVDDVVWDRSLKCYTYGFPGVLIRIEEEMLERVKTVDDGR